MLEDMPSDAELAECKLRDDGLVFTSHCVKTRAAFERELDAFKPDITLIDYHLPAYSGRDALEYARRTHPEIPVIIVTGSLGDEAAVELLKMGARDYVLKNNLARLAPAIRRALSEEKGIRNRKIAERALQESEDKFRTISASAQDAIIMVDNNGKISYWNAAAEKIFGYPAHEALGQGLHTLLAPERFHPDIIRGFAHFRDTGKGPIIGKTVELAALRKDGTEFPVELSLSAIERGSQWNGVGIVRDISGRKADEARLRMFRKLIDKSSDAIEVNDPATLQFMDVNETACRSLGYTREELLAMRIQDIDQEIDESRRKRIGEELQAHGSVIFESRHRRKDGTQFPVEVSLNAVHLDKDYGVSVVRDITERKQTEDALRRSNRALKTISAGNMALVKATNEEELLRTVTNVIVETGGYRMAWVGYAEDDAAKTVRPVAQAGFEEGYLENANITWADTERGQGPTGSAIREGITVSNQDFLANHNIAPWREEAARRGYRSSIAIPLVRVKQVFGALTIYSSEPYAFSGEEVELLEELASDLAYGIETLRTRLAHEQHAAILRQSLEQSIQTIASTLEARDPYTAGHQRRVAELATAIAREMGLPFDQINGIHLAAIIHDLGKIHIPAEILSKPGKLTDIEFALVKTHPQAGYDILKDVKFPWPIADIILQHHEKLDGSGYPQGLKGGQILLESRIMTVADVVEAMSSHRPYRSALGLEPAMHEIERGRGSIYDPAVVDVCLKLFAKKGFAFSGK